MDTNSENSKPSEASEPRIRPNSAGLDASRRRFARNALMGGAVLASLGNRAAWGQAIQGECISANVFYSLSPIGGGLRFASLSPAKQEWSAKIQRMEADVLNPSDMVGTYAGYTERLEYRPRLGTNGKVCVMKTPPTRIGSKAFQTRTGPTKDLGGNLIETRTGPVKDLGGNLIED